MYGWVTLLTQSPALDGVPAEVGDDAVPLAHRRAVVRFRPEVALRVVAQDAGAHVHGEEALEWNFIVTDFRTN